jgi:hypothetical protein
LQQKCETDTLKNIQNEIKTPLPSLEPNQASNSISFTWENIDVFTPGSGNKFLSKIHLSKIVEPKHIVKNGKCEFNYFNQ